ncbi:hypothetical protein CHELA20_51703 [Hyphomicrobiales bacterium]|nr:hypothetical protein CHELA41_23309 [Hyphomicrobiales bacterium]CAH1677907.1 hypothetical protein CHELA20_51703 [Hyphomicrobiales bacterium]
MYSDSTLTIASTDSTRILEAIVPRLRDVSKTFESKVTGSDTSGCGRPDGRAALDLRLVTGLRGAAPLRERALTGLSVCGRPSPP